MLEGQEEITKEEAEFIAKKLGIKLTEIERDAKELVSEVDAELTRVCSNYLKKSKNMHIPHTLAHMLLSASTYQLYRTIMTCIEDENAREVVEKANRDMDRQIEEKVRAHRKEKGN